VRILQEFIRVVFTESAFCYLINSDCLARLKLVHPIFRLYTAQLLLVMP